MARKLKIHSKYPKEKVVRLTLLRAQDSLQKICDEAVRASAEIEKVVRLLEAEKVSND